MNKLVYRIEHPVDKNGMWYTEHGILQKRIHILCPNGIAKDIPMPFNPLHQLNGEVWNSGGKSIENMNEWFTSEDAINLYNSGFKLFEFLLTTNMTQELEHEILFCRKGIIKQKEIPLEVVWKLK